MFRRHYEGIHTIRRISSVGRIKPFTNRMWPAGRGLPTPGLNDYRNKYIWNYLENRHKEADVIKIWIYVHPYKCSWVLIYCSLFVVYSLLGFVVFLISINNMNVDEGKHTISSRSLLFGLSHAQTEAIDSYTAFKSSEHILRNNLSLSSSIFYLLREIPTMNTKVFETLTVLFFYHGRIWGMHEVI